MKEDFKRSDSGQARDFAVMGNDLSLNSVFQALLVFKSLILYGLSTRQRPHQDYSDRRWICITFNLRIVTTTDMLGEPALEGVHTDGADHTMTTFLGSDNMQPNSCASALHTMAQETGIAHKIALSEHRVAVVQHRDLLDTLLIADNERKYSLSPLLAMEPNKRATRDVLIFFTRKPATKGHTCEYTDSKATNQGLPMEIPLLWPDSNPCAP
ncbi:hypothetical protein PG985_005821 [Apiospora marii]|uniref:uncharacterized protein n=1 Tax=Apiospora marii TaxID=335849 RepID=UPI00312F511E